MNLIMIFGTFDIVHPGHIAMFKQAKEYADKLIVVVSRDENLKKNRNMIPFYNENERVEYLKNIKTVDKVVLGYVGDPYRIINEIKPDIIGLGYDQKIYVDKLADAITDFGLNIKIVRFTPYQDDRLKSSRLRNFINNVN